MPYTIKGSKNNFHVVNTSSGKIFSKGTTLPKAKSQIRLLEGIHYGSLIKQKHSK